jgi:hypothetical protein
MMYRTRYALVPTLMACIAATIAPAAAHEAAKGTITLLHPWARATAPGATSSAAFLEIKSSSAGGDKLVAARSPAAGRVELHDHASRSATAAMVPVQAIEVAAGKSLVLGPQGMALMLLDLRAPLKEGDLVALSLRFEKAGEIEVEATVEPAGATGPHGLAHQPGHEPAAHEGGHKH